MAPSVYENIADCNMYESTIIVLKELYVKPQNEIYARHVLATRIQEMNESIDVYLQILKCLSKYCNLTAVTAKQHIYSLTLEMLLVVYIQNKYGKDFKT